MEIVPIPALRNRLTVRLNKDSPKISEQATDLVLLALRPLYASSAFEAVADMHRSSTTRTALACTGFLLQRLFVTPISMKISRVRLLATEIPFANQTVRRHRFFVGASIQYMDGTSRTDTVFSVIPEIT
jgi:hypothetical protein